MELCPGEKPLSEREGGMPVLDEVAAEEARRLELSSEDEPCGEPRNEVMMLSTLKPWLCCCCCVCGGCDCGCGVCSPASKLRDLFEGILPWGLLPLDRLLLLLSGLSILGTAALLLPPRAAAAGDSG